MNMALHELVQYLNGSFRNYNESYYSLKMNQRGNNLLGMLTTI